MPNDHYVSKFLSQRWQDPPGSKLRLYDFERERFERRFPKSVFAEADINTRETEGFLNRFIETPVSGYLARVIGKGAGKAELIDTGQVELYRALVGLVALQVQRVKDAKREGIDGKTLNDLVAGGQPFLDQLVTFTSQRNAVVGITLAQTEALYFNNLGGFVVPIAGDEPARAMALSPRHAVCFAPFGEIAAQQLRGLARAEGSMSAFSIGLGSHVKQVVIAPDRFEALDRDPVAFKRNLLTSRKAAYKVFDLVGEMSAAVGLPSWKVTDPY